MRVTMTAAALALGLMLGQAATAAPKTSDDVGMTEQLVQAEESFDQQAFDQVIEMLEPTVASKGFQTLSPDMQYEALGLYARSLYRVGAFDDAHEAFMDLTANPNATPADWAFRADAAEKAGDAEDAEFAQEHADDNDDYASTVA